MSAVSTNGQIKGGMNISIYMPTFSKISFILESYIYLSLELSRQIKTIQFISNLTPTEKDPSMLEMLKDTFLLESVQSPTC